MFSLWKAARCETFRAFLLGYNQEDPRVTLKIEHTFQVAMLCEILASVAGLSPHDVELAWLCGLLHDVGRFEQLRIWGTFRDADSVDHAVLGARMLSGAYEAPSPCRVGRFVQDEADAGLVVSAVAHHSLLDLPRDLDKRNRTFCEVVRDADKVDILRVYSTSSCTEVLGLSVDEFLAGSISDAAMRGFRERRCLGPSDRCGSLDGLVGAICLVFEMMNREALVLLRQRRSLRNLLQRPFGISPVFRNSETARKWDEIVSFFGEDRIAGH